MDEIEGMLLEDRWVDECEVVPLENMVVDEGKRVMLEIKFRVDESEGVLL